MKIKQATRDGYIECAIGGVADLSYPQSKTRRGRVQGAGYVPPSRRQKPASAGLKGEIPTSIELRNRREAHNQILPKKNTRKAMILDVLRRGDPEGMTADEIQTQLILDGVIPDKNPNYVRPRLSEMKEYGLVEGVNRRLSNAKCKMTVWKVKS